ncbi:sugar-binding transcriptional regulator [Ideonella livida]|uniref:Sugar-binding transcriptional regulator n=1 Tax=Ideonella livida TaxID=2707176 RepID=A0A7C9TKL7_9BURK|nr:sugar-binding transcriptional regulator [Ideonella livida]NDY92919.1 sugar-binding transcriptional regulator [Ideonella livida]
MDSEHSLSIRAAWLAYVGGYTQEQIAERLGVSRIKAQRLVAAAMQNGLVKFWVEGVPAECMALEDELMKTFGLKRAVVVPNTRDEDDGDEPGSEMAALAVAGARYLVRELEAGQLRAVGVGHGRTLAALVDRLPKLSLPDMRFVSLLGSLTRSSAANPFDVIARLAERTGGECFFLPVPFIADSQADAEVLRAQRGVQQVFGLIRDCQLCVVGVGDLGPNAHLQRTHSVTAAERQALIDAGAVGEVAGRFVTAEGRMVDSEMNGRAVGASLEDLRGREVLAVAGGTYKAGAIRAVLRSGVLTALIVDEATARQVLRPEVSAR